MSAKTPDPLPRGYFIGSAVALIGSIGTLGLRLPAEGTAVALVMSYMAGASLWLAGTERGAEWLQRPVVITVLHSVVVAIALLLAGVLVLAGPLLSWLD
jgi:hypothetical protein